MQPEAFYLSDIFTALKQYRLKIILHILLGGLALFLAGTLVENKYIARTSLMPGEASQNSQNGSFSTTSKLSKLIGGGGGTTSSGSVQETLAIIQSRDFIVEFSKAHQLEKIWFSDLWDNDKKQWKNSTTWQKIKKTLSRKYQGAEIGDNSPKADEIEKRFKKIFSVNMDDETGLIYITSKWTNPDLATRWLDDLVKFINTYVRNRVEERAQRNVHYLSTVSSDTQNLKLKNNLTALLLEEQRKIMLTSAQPQYAFLTISSANTDNYPTSPPLVLLFILGCLLGGFFAIVKVTINIDNSSKRFAE